MLATGCRQSCRWRHAPTVDRICELVRRRISCRMRRRAQVSQVPVARPPFGPGSRKDANGTRFPSALGTCQKSHPLTDRSAPDACLIAATPAVDGESNSSLPTRTLPVARIVAASSTLCTCASVGCWMSREGARCQCCGRATRREDIRGRLRRRSAAAPGTLMVKPRYKKPRRLFR